jgi:hypothetical protein
MAYVRRATLLTISSIILLAAGPSTRPVHGLDDVDANYRDRAGFAKNQYDEAMNKAAAERLEGMRVLQDRAMKLEDIDGAVSIKKKIEELKGEGIPDADDPSITARRVLESRLAGTRWHCPTKDGTWLLRRDGTVLRSDGSPGEWAAIGPTTILIHLNAEGAEWTDKWKFNDELTMFRDLHAKIGDPWIGEKL